jgi:hypothetical protein
MNSPKELKQAYQLVSQDLFNRLVKAQNGETIYLGTRGSFGSLKKSESQTKSALDGNTYAFYRLNFKPSRHLKSELNKALERKYK